MSGVGKKAAHFRLSFPIVEVGDGDLAIRVDMFPLADLEGLVREDVDDRGLGGKVEREPDRDGAMVRVCADRDGEDARQREQQLDPSVVVGWIKKLQVSVYDPRCLRPQPARTKVALFGVDEARKLVQDRKGLLRGLISARVLREHSHCQLHEIRSRVQTYSHGVSRLPRSAPSASKPSGAR